MSAQRAQQEDPTPVTGVPELAELAVELAGTLEPDQVIESVLRRGLSIAKADRATLSSIDGRQLTIEATYGRAGDLTWIGRAYSMEYLTAQPVVRRALDTLQPTFGGTLDVGAAAPEFKTALESVRHTAVMPLVFQRQPVGLLVLSRYDDPGFQRQDVLALPLLGTVAGLALRNARLHHQAQEAREQADRTARHMQTAIEAAEDVARQVELSAVLQRLLHRAVEASGADHASLARLEEANLVLEASTGSVPIGSRWPIAPAVLAGIRSGQAVQLPATEYMGTPAGLEKVVQPFERFLVVPLMLAGEVVGLFALARYQDRAFDEREISALQQFSTLAALLLRNARLLDRALEAEKAKGEFMDLAVHELRTPLSVAAGYLSMVQDGDLGDLPASLRQPLGIAEAKTREAIQMAEELLSLARLEGGRLNLLVQSVDAARAVREAADRVGPRAALAGVTVTVVLGEPVTLRADPELVGRILDNLLNNAVAYSGQDGRITIRIDREAERARIIIRDTGRGIPEAEHEAIFGRFVRGADPAVRSVRGTGLGLYISRGFAERMGGSLTLLDSAAGKGSTFLVELPLG